MDQGQQQENRAKTTSVNRIDKFDKPTHRDNLSQGYSYPKGTASFTPPKKPLTATIEALTTGLRHPCQNPCLN